jgi:hypothetical protein
LILRSSFSERKKKKRIFVMLRRQLQSHLPVRASAVAAMLPVVAAPAARSYRTVPHINYEVEELAETQRRGRWSTIQGNLQGPYKKAEIMCQKLNYREARRIGWLPEKSIIRKQSQFYQKDGHICEPHYKTKLINFTVVGFDGHPFYFRMPPMPTVTLNTLIDGTTMVHGQGNFWSKCTNPDCNDKSHGDGCMVNVDLETLDLLPPPSRSEYNHLAMHANMGRPDITFNTRFSCQITLSEELDGALFALKQFYSTNLRASVCNWSSTDDYGTFISMRSRKVEPWAPLIEEKLVQDFPYTIDMLWAESYQDIMAVKNPNYVRTDGTRTRPSHWMDTTPTRPS